MKTRFLGNSGLRVSTLSLGTMTFGGTEPAFAKMGNITGKEADRFVGRAIDAGINLFDTADAYSAGESERVLGEAIKPYRDRALIATKAFARMGDGPNNLGNSRHHLIKACEASLRRLGTDHIDLYQVHGQDLLTPVEETIAALDSLVTSGKVRYIGCSNHSGWFLMKSLAVADYRHTTRYVAHH
ncbi:MAG: aldo/keto reductase [Chloroflexota bacterium]